MVRESPWPFFSAVALMGLVKGFLESWGGLLGWIGVLVVFISLGLLVVSVYEWCANLMAENVAGAQGFELISSLMSGFVLFLLTEVMLFVSFFWGYLSKSWVPEVAVGSVWPPFGFELITIHSFGLPLLNTLILLASGVTVTLAHKQVCVGSSNGGLWLFGTACLGVFFLVLQSWEYAHAEFSIGGGILGSSFYMLTGLHGFHVCVGTVLLFLCAFKSVSSALASSVHVGMRMAVWYWHFVDVVWLWVFVLVYWYA